MSTHLEDLKIAKYHAIKGVNILYNQEKNGCIPDSSNILWRKGAHHESLVTSKYSKSNVHGRRTPVKTS